MTPPTVDYPLDSTRILAYPNGALVSCAGIPNRAGASVEAFQLQPSSALCFHIATIPEPVQTKGGTFINMNTFYIYIYI